MAIIEVEKGQVLQMIAIDRLTSLEIVSVEPISKC
jgi:hypothetical protein